MQHRILGGLYPKNNRHARLTLRSLKQMRCPPEWSFPSRMRFCKQSIVRLMAVAIYWMKLNLTQTLNISIP